MRKQRLRKIKQPVQVLVDDQETKARSSPSLSFHLYHADILLITTIPGVISYWTFTVCTLSTTNWHLSRAFDRQIWPWNME